MAKEIEYMVEIDLKIRRPVVFYEDEEHSEEDAIDYAIGNLFEMERGSWQHNMDKLLRKKAIAYRIDGGDDE